MRKKLNLRRTIRRSVMTGAVLGCALAAAGCSQYTAGEGMRAQAEALRPESRETGPDQSIAGFGQEERESLAAAETSRLETERTTASVPEFEAEEDMVYVKTPGGGSVRIRSACDTSDGSNILTYVVPGTKLLRTGKNDQWTRVNYKGFSGYIATAYISTEAPEQKEAFDKVLSDSPVSLDGSWKYAKFSKINSGSATMYRSHAAERKDITICVNAGHGTLGGSSVKTLCHPDGTPKVTGGTTGAGAVTAVAVSSGMTFLDGTPESRVTLAMANVFKDKLLAAGYDVLMIRESDDVQLDNVARTVIANNASDCHIALHWDSTESDKGAFYMSVPNVESYRNMEPVKSNWQKHNALGESLVAGLKGKGVKIFSGGSMAMDLTQTSYSTVPSIDIELGDRASDYSQATLDKLGDGLVAGVNQYFGR
ncbi:MAG: N-acetylmuramoyl-L-alanine amidase [Clostridiaceae bacterium]|uniref:N-acetylmuramoyl-L-alanine amidase n=1 Tax=Clostridium porci TaxID=2605778 RepID=A0A7X2TBM7_9CLOT|nr:MULTISPECIES: N-acetylmuramoyl-L-alanine amidase [Clostridium]MCI6138460.1 N-acetylmuramoyl-L-alanine amidase [Clostridium sp.]MDY3231137.1 N-acetylmuramoyl-L-alanine amidase [Clostridiaceae bacterium]MSS35620.1 N-acetylmuramoyl-L-alanine amidase [Clostridium porci]